ncbi:hypothetical protein D9M68_637810 [compost metagenome]
MGSYSICSWISLATSSPHSSATTFNPMSMPDVTPPAVNTRPSTHMRSSLGMAPKRDSNSRARQWLDARLPRSSPAAPSSSDPVQMPNTYCASSPCLCVNATQSGSTMASSVPGPPGTTSRSQGGADAMVCVGTKHNPRSDRTGSRVFATKSTVKPGAPANTSYGPVISSWVSPSNKRKFTCMTMLP